MMAEFSSRKFRHEFRVLDGDRPRESLVNSPFAHSGWVGMTIDSMVAI